MARQAFARICENGHIINQDTEGDPDREKKFCQQCGAKTITGCQQCGAQFKGYVVADEDLEAYTILESIHDVPNHCAECGKLLPWAATAVSEALMLAEDVREWDGTDKGSLKEALPDLIAQTPKTPRAVATVKRLASKSAASMQRILEGAIGGLLCAMAKRALWGVAGA